MDYDNEDAGLQDDFLPKTEEEDADMRAFLDRMRGKAMPADAAEDWAAAAKRWGIESVDFINVCLEDDYLIKGMLAAGAMSVIYGPSNSGKTFLALDMAYRIAAGVWWHGLRVKPAAVLYLATEGGRGLTNRLVALRDEHGKGHPFFVRRAGIDLLTGDADMGLIIEMINGVREHTEMDEVLVVIDTLSRAMAGGDENGSVDMTKVVKRCDMIRAGTGAHLMLVHHTGKDIAKGARGHSSLKAATDTEIEVAQDAEIDGLKHAVVRKQRDYEGGKVFDFVLRTIVLGKDGDGDDVTTCIAAQMSDSAFGGIDPRDEETILAEIDIGLDNGERYTDQRTSRDTSRWAGHIVSGSLGIGEDEAQAVLDYWLRHKKLFSCKYRSNMQRKDRTGLFRKNIENQ